MPLSMWEDGGSMGGQIPNPWDNIWLKITEWQLYQALFSPLLGGMDPFFLCNAS